MTINKTAGEAALQVMRSHLYALNLLKEDDLAQTLHFPHYRLVGNELNFWGSKETYLSDFRLRAGESWARTEWSSINIHRKSSDKVHLIVEISRFNNKNELIKKFDSFWVITFKDGKWAVQFRSSFADS